MMLYGLVGENHFVGVMDGGLIKVEACELSDASEIKVLLITFSVAFLAL